MLRRIGTELIDPAGARIGEGPAWDVGAACLVWIDVLAGRVFRTEPDGGRRATYQLDRHVGAALPAADGGLLLVRRDGFARMRADGSVDPLLDVLTDTPDLRFNDAKCDGGGRAFAGTMCYDEMASDRGVLLRLDPGPAVTRVFGPTSLSNGLDWSPDGHRMYFVDSHTHVVTIFDYDTDTSTPHDPRPFLHIDVPNGGPDGMCVDDDGCLWVALWGGAVVRRYTPDGRTDAEVELPVRKVSSCAFGPGGRLYITTASEWLTPAERAAQPLAGGLFVAEPGVTGSTATPWSPV